MSNETDVELELTRCIWCCRTLHGAEQSITVRPPQGTGSSFYEWDLHLECAQEWTETIDRIARLRRLGAGATLLTAAEHDGVDSLLSDDDRERLEGDRPQSTDSKRSELPSQ
ncbi:hypothetical protein [Natrononativus amylolyticus]|uniref:hypothetical protein n=1 Tax=Natrononativus amylolyticus TaxID=2963434 RepID=UPI0020CDE8D5|nr:hypothetical protein [Natrononativus amylolyticus]